MHRWKRLLALGLMGCQPDQPGVEKVHHDTGTDETTDTAEAGVIAELDDTVQSLFDGSKMPGFAAALVANGEVVWVGAYGMANIEEGHPVTEDTAWLMASVSKLMTGTAVMQMVEAGLFDLDTPINDVLDFTYDNPKTEDEEVLVKHLVSHTSGIYDDWVWGAPGQEGALYSDGDSDIALGEFMEGYFLEGGEWYDAQANFIDALPGEMYMYTNIGASLAGHLIGPAIGEGLDDYSIAALFEPLGMTNSAWKLAYLDESTVAMPYRLTSDSPVPYGHFGFPDYPDGLLRTSAADMGRFLAAYANGGQIDGQMVLEAETVTSMFESIVPEVDPTQGIFWYWSSMNGRDLIGHNGSDFGVSAELLLDPVSGVGVVVMTNANWGSGVTGPIAAIEEAMFVAGESL